MDAESPTVSTSSGQDTAAALTEHPTELIETGAAPTPELAWSDTDEQETEATSETRSRALWLVPVVALLAAAITVASALLLYTHRAPATAPTNSARAPAPPPLNGTYRLDYDFTRQTFNGALVPQPNIKNTGWWAFRSSCRPTGCVATSTKLDKDNHHAAQSPTVTVQFHFADGHWQAVPFREQAQQPSPCLAANGEVVGKGEYTKLKVLSMDPQPDGALQGIQTETVLSNECGNQGQVHQAPFIATQTGGLPPGVVVADPATVASPPGSNTTFPPIAGQALDGIFRLDFDYAKQTVDGTTVANPPPNDSLWWAFRSSCSIAGCVATGVAMASETPIKQDGSVRATDVLHFADGYWQDTAAFRPSVKCREPTNGTTTDNEEVSWSWENQPGGTLRGVQTITVLTNECGDQGKIYRTPFSATRVGDVPSTVTLADPALF